MNGSGKLWVVELRLVWSDSLSMADDDDDQQRVLDVPVSLGQ